MLVHVAPVIICMCNVKSNSLFIEMSRFLAVASNNLVE